MNQFHAVVVRFRRDFEAWFRYELVVLERSIVYLMLPAVPLSYYLYHVRMLLSEGFGHLQSPVALIKFVGIAALHFHRNCLVSEKGVKQDCAQA